MKIKLIFAAFFLLTLLTLILTPRFVSYLGFFPYRDHASTYGLPPFLNSLANFDGVHYLLITNQGYSQYEQSFFPLYPILIKSLSVLLFHNYFLSAILISNLALILAVLIFFRYLRLINFSSPFWFIVFLLFFPTSFYFSAAYTESLFLLLFIASLYSLQRRHYFLAFILAALCSATRVIGVFLFLPFLITFLSSSHRRPGPLLALLGPITGLSAYSLYLYLAYGDPLYYFHALPAFGTGRSASIILLPQVIYRYLKIFVLAAPNFQYFIAVLEFVLFCLAFFSLIYLLYRFWQTRSADYPFLGIYLFSAASLILPTLTGTLNSIPRYLLLVPSLFLFLASIRNRSLKIVILLLFIVLRTILFAYFIQGYFIA
jgi:Gpi18-like mannosyltransferase